MSLRNGGGSDDFFFVATAHWQLGQNDDARTWFGNAVEWMDKNAPQHAEFLRFRAEAAALLGISDAKPSTLPASPPNN